MIHVSILVITMQEKYKRYFRHPLFSQLPEEISLGLGEGGSDIVDILLERSEICDSFVTGGVEGLKVPI